MSENTPKGLKIIFMSGAADFLLCESNTRRYFAVETDEIDPLQALLSAGYDPRTGSYIDPEHPYPRPGHFTRDGKLKDAIPSTQDATPAAQDAIITGEGMTASEIEAIPLPGRASDKVMSNGDHTARVHLARQIVGVVRRLEMLATFPSTKANRDFLGAEANHALYTLLAIGLGIKETDIRPNDN